MRGIKCFLIGLAMGIADLIPGVSGGTIAFISGIYDQLLESIKSLQFHTPSKIAWSFILPLGGGLLLALFLLSKSLYFLLTNYPAPLYALFFGIVLGSALFCWRKAELKPLPHAPILIVGAALSFLLTSLSPAVLLGESFLGLMLSGCLAGCVMLLPGISGSYLLHLLGVYPLMLASLSNPTFGPSIKVLMAMGLGLSFGLMAFSRGLSFLLIHFRQLTMAILIGFMVGGLHSLWFTTHWYCALVGFLVIILLELRTKSTISLDNV